jgi:hypothetical protein
LGGHAVSGCVWKLVSTVIDLNGEWKPANFTRSVVISVSGSSSITIDRMGAPPFGIIVDPSTIKVTFPDDNKTYTGKLEPPNRIRWFFSNSEEIWTKVEKPKPHRNWEEWLNGWWDATGNRPPEGPGPTARISVSGNSITIDMSQYNRPIAHGSILNDSTFTAKFPDDANVYSAGMENSNRISWSNGTVWKRVFFEG